MLKHEIVLHEESLPVNIRSYRSRNNLIPGHWHSHVEILYIKKGTMEVQCANENRTLVTGDIFIINSGEIHQTRIGKETETLMLQIPYFLISRSLPDEDPIHFASPPAESEISRTLAPLLLKLLHVYQTRERGYMFLFRSILQQLLYHLVADCSLQTALSATARRHRTKMQKLLTHIEENYTTPLTVREGAKLMNFNADYFCRFFKKQTGSTFLEYVNLIRLTHIHHDLMNSNETLTEILNRHGFTNYKVFSRMFKEHYHSTPSRLRSSGDMGGPAPV